MVNFCAVCGCCTRTDIVREHLEDTHRICDVSAMGLFFKNVLFFPIWGALLTGDPVQIAPFGPPLGSPVDVR
jgi:hypothetical protein